MSNKKYSVVAVMLILLLALSSCSLSKRRCAQCGKTEEEAELRLFSSEEYSDGDDKYYCDVCLRYMVGNRQIPGVADEIEKVLGTSSEGSESETQPTETVDYSPLVNYVKENVQLMGTMITKRVEFDVNKDGYPDLCASVSTGSGIISSLIAVYDVHNDVGYMLHDRGEYDYFIKGNSDDLIAIERSNFSSSDKTKTYGTLAIEDGKLVFVKIEK